MCGQMYWSGFSRDTELIGCLCMCVYIYTHIEREREGRERGRGFPGGAVVKNLPASTGDARDMGLISRSGSSPGEGNGNPLQYSCLENCPPPWTEEPGGLQSMGSQRVRHDCVSEHTHIYREEGV